MKRYLWSCLMQLPPWTRPPVSSRTLDDAIANLATWMNMARKRLTEDVWVALAEIGGLLYREGVKRRASP